MGWIDLKAADGHRLRAWEARPPTPPRGALVVLQEIFGVNAHVRTVCEQRRPRGFGNLAGEGCAHHDGIVVHAMRVRQEMREGQRVGMHRRVPACARQECRDRVVESKLSGVRVRPSWSFLVWPWIEM